MKKYFVPIILFLVSSGLHGQALTDSIARHSDSIITPEFQRFAGYAGIGFPLGIGMKGTYRPINEIAFSLSGNLTLPVPYVTPSGRPSVGIGLSVPVEKIDAKGHQDGLSASFIILTGSSDSYVSYDQLNTLAIAYGSMPGSQPVFNWKIGAMLFLRDHATTFLHRIEGMPILSISWRIF